MLYNSLDSKTGLRSLCINTFVDVEAILFSDPYKNYTGQAEILIYKKGGQGHE